MTTLPESTLREALRHYESGQLDEAELVCRSVLTGEPYNINALRLVADIALRRGDLNARLCSLQKLVALRPEQPIYLFDLGMAHLQAGNLETARQYLQTAVRLKPDFGEAQSRLCGVSGQLGYFEEAVTAGEDAVRNTPSAFVAQLNLAAAYDAVGRADEALKHYKQAAELAPRHPIVQCCLGDALVGKGNKHEAERCYREAIALDPGYTPPYRQLSRLIKYTSPAHEDFARIEKMLRNDSMPLAHRSHLHFALGKMYEDCGLYDHSFHHLKCANEIENRNHPFDPRPFTDSLTRIVHTFTPEFITAQRHMGNPSMIPVFIVSMPRSGSTLVEQIITSHPQSSAGGEFYWFGQIEKKLESILGSNLEYPECSRLLKRTTMLTLASLYLGALQATTNHRDVLRITDKLPGNFLHLGLIHLLFPNARIIHCRRNPLDTCFSIYSIMSPGHLTFSHSLVNIGTVYNGYARLMRHWYELMPEQILTVDYEDLVMNQNTISRKIIDFIGLPWDDRCCDFTHNARSVRTISAFQVRQGIYTNSIGRWKRYEEHLDPLRDILDFQSWNP